MHSLAVGQGQTDAHTVHTGFPLISEGKFALLAKYLQGSRRVFAASQLKSDASSDAVTQFTNVQRQVFSILPINIGPAMVEPTATALPLASISLAKV